MADQKMSDATPSVEKHRSSLRRSLGRSSEQYTSSKVTVSQVADSDASADVSARSTTSRKSGLNQRVESRPRRILGIPTRGVKRRVASPSPSPPSSPPLPPSPTSLPQKSSKSSRPSLPPPRLLFPHVKSRSQVSKPTHVEIIEILSDDSGSEPDPSTAQTTPDPSPAQKKKQAPSENSRTVRPISERRRIVSAPTPLTGGGSSGTKARRAQDIDGGIEEQMRQPQKLRKKDKKLGYVYVVPAIHTASGKKLIKIGVTAEPSVETRLKAITKGLCKNTIDLLPLSESSPEHTQVHLFYEQVEKLAHRELANFRYDFTCRCGTRHEEFFTLDEEVGHMAVERWARFCALRPFTNDWRLKDEWKFHLDQFRERNHSRPSNKQHEKKDDHLGRHQRWESFLASKRSDWYSHRAGVLRNKTWAHRWQLWSLVLAFLLVISTWSWWSSSVFVVTAGFIYGEESTRDSVVDLASLLLDVGFHYLREWSLVSETLTSTADEDEQVEVMDGERGGLYIWDDSEEGAETRDTEQEEAEDEGEDEEEEEDDEKEDDEDKGEDEEDDRLGEHPN